MDQNIYTSMGGEVKRVDLIGEVYPTTEFLRTRNSNLDRSDFIGLLFYKAMNGKNESSLFLESDLD